MLTWLGCDWTVYCYTGGAEWNAINGTSIAHLRIAGVSSPRLWFRAADGTALMRRADALRLATAAVAAVGRGNYRVQRYDAEEGGLAARLGTP
jgi:hypothetical protein